MSVKSSLRTTVLSLVARLLTKAERTADDPRDEYPEAVRTLAGLLATFLAGVQSGAGVAPVAPEWGTFRADGDCGHPHLTPAAAEACAASRAKGDTTQPTAASTSAAAN